jgi:hypothetical protein
VSAPDDAESDPRLAEYVAAFREVEAPADPQVRATWAAVQAKTAQPAPSRWVAWAVVAAAAALVLAFLQWRSPSAREDADAPRDQTQYGSQDPATGGPVQRAPDPPAVPPRTAAAASVEEPPTEAMPTPTSPESAPAGGTQAPAPATERPSVRRPTSLPPKEPAPSERSALAEETDLLGRIKAALGRDEADEALKLIADHARRFPRGVFASERSVAKARALCALGRRAEAREVAQRFIDAHPQSHLVAQMELICRP